MFPVLNYISSFQCLKSYSCFKFVKNNKKIIKRNSYLLENNQNLIIKIDDDGLKIFIYSHSLNKIKDEIKYIEMITHNPEFIITWNYHLFDESEKNIKGSSKQSSTSNLTDPTNTILELSNSSDEHSNSKNDGMETSDAVIEYKWKPLYGIYKFTEKATIEYLNLLIEEIKYFKGAPYSGYENEDYLQFKIDIIENIINGILFQEDMFKEFYAKYFILTEFIEEYDKNEIVPNVIIILKKLNLENVTNISKYVDEIDINLNVESLVDYSLSKEIYNNWNNYLKYVARYKLFSNNQWILFKPLKNFNLEIYNLYKYISLCIYFYNNFDLSIIDSVKQEIFTLLIYLRFQPIENDIDKSLSNIYEYLPLYDTFTKSEGFIQLFSNIHQDNQFLKKILNINYSIKQLNKIIENNKTITEDELIVLMRAKNFPKSRDDLEIIKYKFYEALSKERTSYILKLVDELTQSCNSKNIMGILFATEYCNIIIQNDWDAINIEHILQKLKDIESKNNQN
jgi:hypothetical protein